VSPQRSSAGSRVENERQPEEHCHKSKWNPEVEIAN
jgi:hypothetical protein